MNPNEAPICQSCSMPMTDASKFGTEKDDSPSKDYCVHCYKKGAFTRPNTTIEEMIELYAPRWGQWTGRPDLSIEQAKVEIFEKLSPLKRWKKKSGGCCCCKH